MTRAVWFLFLPLLVVLLGRSVEAQITIRDRIVKLPASSCKDGATHLAKCSKIRLVAAVKNLQLSSFENQAVEIFGGFQGGNCPLLQVRSVQRLAVELLTTTGIGGASIAAFFHGRGASTDTFLLGVSTPLATPILLPGIQGPLHLDPKFLVVLGRYQPRGLNAPFLSLRVPRSQNLLGVDFFAQAAVQHSNGAEMTNLDCFRL